MTKFRLKQELHILIEKPVLIRIFAVSGCHLVREILPDRATKGKEHARNSEPPVVVAVTQ